MKIERLEIEGFGHFRDHQLTLRPGLNLLCGNNEAGKSTLLAFMRAVLFGFEKRSSAARYEPAQPPFGGHLHLLTHFGRLQVRRTASKRAEGELAVWGPEGEVQPASRLADALAGISKELFFEVFAFGLHELASFERLANQGSVSQALFAAGMEGAQRLPVALEALRKSSESLFTPKGIRPALNGVLEELALTGEKLRALGDRPALYFQATARLAEVEGELSQLEDRLSKASQQRLDLSRLAAVLPELQQLAQTEAELGGLPELGSFPEGGMARLTDLEERLSAATLDGEEQRAKLCAIEEQLRFVLDGPPKDEAALKLCLETFTGLKGVQQGLTARRVAGEQKRAAVDRSLAGLGLALQGTQLLGLDLGAASKGALATLRDRSGPSELLLAQREETWRTSKGRKEMVEAEVRRLVAQVAKLPSTPAALLRRRLAALEQLSAARESAANLQSRLGELRAARQALFKDREASPRESFPIWALGLALLVLLGLGISSWSAGLGMGLLASGAALALGALLVLLQRRAAQGFAEQQRALAERRAAQHQEQVRLDGEVASQGLRLEEAQAALLSLVQQSGAQASDGPARWQELIVELGGELEKVEWRSRLSQELEGLTARLAAAVHEEKEAKADRDVSEAALSQLSREVDAMATPRGLPRGLSAAAALDLWNEAASLKVRLQELLAEEGALLADEGACEEAARAVVAAARGANLLEAAAQGAGVAAQALSDLLGEDQQAKTRRQLLAEKKEAGQSALARATRAAKEAGVALSALLQAAGAADGEGFRLRASQAAQWAQASRAARELQARIEAGSGRAVDEAKAQLVAQGGQALLSHRLEQLADQCSSLSEAAKQLAAERGALCERVQGYERDAEVCALRSKEEHLRAQACELAGRYVTDRLALLLLKKAQRHFEDEQQPRVVQRASRIFSELTFGRYPKVYVGPDKDLALRDTTGKDWSAEKLSRGTRELLYLAFRLAVIEDFGQTRAALPVILDDILVNLDPERTRATIAALARLSGAHQVIAFSCHPDLEALFAAQGAHLVPLQGDRI